MRKVTEKMAQALRDNETTTSGNTTVAHGEMLLHGNRIASLWDVQDEGQLKRQLNLYDAGWRTNTTKERLNGILQVFGIHGHIFQKNGEWLYQDHETLVNTEWRGQKEFSL